MKYKEGLSNKLKMKAKDWMRKRREDPEKIIQDIKDQLENKSENLLETGKTIYGIIKIMDFLSSMKFDSTGDAIGALLKELPDDLAKNIFEPNGVADIIDWLSDNYIS